MIVKEATHSRYLEDQLAKHGGKGLAYNRHALVIGAEGKNIGSAIANELDTLGWSVEAPWRGDLDLTVPPDLDAQDWSQFDTLVLANGYTHMDWIEDQPDDQVFRVLADSLLASMLATRRFVEATIDADYRKYILYIGSMAHRSVLNASAPYCAAKAGLHQYARCAGWELTPKGYRVFIIHPSNTKDTPMTEATIEGIMRVRGVDRDAAERYWASINLMPEWLTADAIARTAGEVLSGSHDYLSGTAIEMTGGQR